MTKAAAGCVVESHSEGVHVWFILGKSRRKEGSELYTCSLLQSVGVLDLTWKLLYLQMRRSRQHFRDGREVVHHLELMTLCSLCNDVYKHGPSYIIIALNTYLYTYTVVCTLY